MARRVEWEQDNVVSQEPNVAVKSEIGDWKKKIWVWKIIVEFWESSFRIIKDKNKRKC